MSSNYQLANKSESQVRVWFDEFANDYISEIKLLCKPSVSMMMAAQKAQSPATDKKTKNNYVFLCLVLVAALLLLIYVVYIMVKTWFKYKPYRNQAPNNQPETSDFSESTHEDFSQQVSQREPLLVEQLKEERSAETGNAAKNLYYNSDKTLSD